MRNSLYTAFDEGLEKKQISNTKECYRNKSL